MYDPEIKHWEVKSNVYVGPKFFRVNTIRLINGKYETAVMDSDRHNMIPNMNIYFYNSHENDIDALNFNNDVTQKMRALNNKYAFDENSDFINTIALEIPELNRYTKSVPYEYPEDLFGESYR